MSRNNIIPNDINSARGSYAMSNSADIYRGTSFKFSGSWTENTHYFNDEYIVDFVSYNGTLWACQFNHLSTNGTQPSDHSRYWTEVISGIPGKVYVPKVVDGKLTFVISDDIEESSIEIERIKGDTGKTYKPTEIKDSELYFEAEDGSIVKVNVEGLRGERGLTGEPGKDGKTPTFLKTVKIYELEYGSPAEARLLPVSVEDEIGYQLELRIPEGRQGVRGIQGEKGDVGEAGKDAPIPLFKLTINSSTKTVDLIWSSDEGTSWKNLGSVGGKSPKLMRVLGELNNPEYPDGNRANDRILWGYDGIPTSEWTTLCYLDELRGDQNIVIGCPNELQGYYGKYDEYGGPADHEKIWFDPCDQSMDQYSASDLLYSAYLELAGDKAVSKREFEVAFTDLSKSGLKLIVSYSLPEPSKDLCGHYIYAVPYALDGQNNRYDEYIVVEEPQGTGKYRWEMLGSRSAVEMLKKAIEDLKQTSNDSYNTLNSKITKLENSLDTLVNGDVNGVIDSYNEVIDFLDGVTEDVNFIKTIDGLKDSIEDLDQSKADKSYVDEELSKKSVITVDENLSSTSENPVKNKVIYEALQGKANAQDIYSKTESDNKYGTLEEQKQLRNDVEQALGEIAEVSTDKADKTELEGYVTKDSFNSTVSDLNRTIGENQNSVMSTAGQAMSTASESLGKVDALMSWQTTYANPNIASLLSKVPSLEQWRDESAIPAISKVSENAGKIDSLQQWKTSETVEIGSIKETANEALGKVNTVNGYLPTDASESNKLATSRQVSEYTQNYTGSLINPIKDVIPTQATASNQLADKEFVNSSISTNTADFKGTFTSLEELQKITADINDYGFVIVKDEAGNTVYKRYKHDGIGWRFEYDLNNSSFTANQWAAIQSGITEALVAKLNSLPNGSDIITSKQAAVKYQPIGEYVTADEVVKKMGTYTYTGEGNISIDPSKYDVSIITLTGDVTNLIFVEDPPIGRSITIIFCSDSRRTINFYNTKLKGNSLGDSMIDFEIPPYGYGEINLIYDGTYFYGRYM